MMERDQRGERDGRPHFAAAQTALLLSGGIDSAALAWQLRPALAITIDYGQRAATGEIRAARTLCRTLGIEHDVVEARAPSVGVGEMSTTSAPSNAPSPEWWPYRNQLLVTLAAARIIALGYAGRIRQLAVGSVESDGHRHIDGQAAFYAQLDALLALQEEHLHVIAPALTMDSVALVRASGIPWEVLAWAHSCYRGDVACGACGGCEKFFGVLRALGWDAAPS